MTNYLHQILRLKLEEKMVPSSNEISKSAIIMVTWLAIQVLWVLSVHVKDWYVLLLRTAQTSNFFVLAFSELDRWTHLQIICSKLLISIQTEKC